MEVELERETKVLQFDVCCEAIDQNFDCGYALKKDYALISEFKQKHYNTENLELLASKSSLRPTEKYVCLPS